MQEHVLVLVNAKCNKYWVSTFGRNEKKYCLVFRLQYLFLNKTLTTISMHDIITQYNRDTTVSLFKFWITQKSK